MQSPPSPDHSLMPLVPTRVTTYSKQKRVRFVLSAASRPTTLHPPIKVCSSWRQRACSSLSTQSALKVVGKENVPHNVVTPARAVAGKKKRHAEEINLSKKKKKTKLIFCSSHKAKRTSVYAGDDDDQGTNEDAWTSLGLPSSGSMDQSFVALPVWHSPAFDPIGRRNPLGFPSNASPIQRPSKTVVSTPPSSSYAVSRYFNNQVNDPVCRIRDSVFVDREQGQGVGDRSPSASSSVSRRPLSPFTFTGIAATPIRPTSSSRHRPQVQGHITDDIIPDGMIQGSSDIGGGTSTRPVLPEPVKKRREGDKVEPRRKKSRRHTSAGEGDEEDELLQVRVRRRNEPDSLVWQQKLD